MGSGAPVSPIDPGDTLLLVAGPCALEDDGTNLRIARRLREVGARLGLHDCYKASFDKANRTSLSSRRGPALETGLRRLRRVLDRPSAAAVIPGAGTAAP